jgi:hypothetical protein
MSKKIQGFIRDIPGGTPITGIDVTIMDANTNVAIPTGGNYGGSANPVTTDISTGLFTWTCDLSPGPLLVSADLGGGDKKVRSGLEMMQQGDAFISDTPEFGQVFTNGVLQGIGNQFTSSAVGLAVTVQSGIALLKGRVFDPQSSRIVSVPSNATLTTRLDYIVLQQYVGGSYSGRQEIAIKVGVVNNTLPTLNTDPNIFEFPIYTSSLALGGGTAALTDVRTYATTFIPDASILSTKLKNNGIFSTAEIAQVLKSAISPGTGVSLQPLAIGELSDVAVATPTNGQLLSYSTVDNLYHPVTDITGKGNVTTYVNSAAIGTRRGVNISPGNAAVSIVAADDAANDRVNMTITPLYIVNVITAGNQATSAEVSPINDDSAWHDLVTASITLPSGTWSVSIHGGANLAHSSSSLINRRTVLGGSASGFQGAGMQTTREHYPFEYSLSPVAAGTYNAKLQYQVDPGGGNGGSARCPWIHVDAVRIT